MAASESRSRVLIVLHQAHSTSGRVGWLLKRMGVELDVRRPPLGDELPETLAEHDGVIVFGGPMSANEDSDWMNREIAWLEVPLRENKPFLGICLGAQMMARQLGARVFNHGCGYKEIGYFPIEPLPEADTICAAPWPRNVYHWHRDGFDVPAGARVLARGDSYFPTQAYQLGRALCLQFHPEVTYAMICRWTARHDHTTLGLQSAIMQRNGWFEHDRAVAEWISALLPEWLAGRLPGTAETGTGVERQLAVA
jgi:GMP synthase (glutamine-hydrolysing)